MARYDYVPIARRQVVLQRAAAENGRPVLRGVATKGARRTAYLRMGKWPSLAFAVQDGILKGRDCLLLQRRRVVR